MTDAPAAPSATTARSRRGLASTSLAAVLLLVAATAAACGSSSSTPSVTTHPGPEGVFIADVPNLAPQSTTASGAPVGGIRCRTVTDQNIVNHTHTLLTVYVNGSQRRIPAGVGLTHPWFVNHFPTDVFYEVGPYNCSYYLHTHTPDGIVHVESPTGGTFTLGQFFAVWNQPLTTDQVGPAHGKVTAFVDGKQVTGDPGAIPLKDLQVIQLDVGTPVVPFQAHRYKVTGLCASGSSCVAK